MTLCLSFHSCIFLLLFVVVSVGSELHSTHLQFAPASAKCKRPVAGDFKDRLHLDMLIYCSNLHGYQWITSWYPCLNYRNDFDLGINPSLRLSSQWKRKFVAVRSSFFNRCILIGEYYNYQSIAFSNQVGYTTEDNINPHAKDTTAT